MLSLQYHYAGLPRNWYHETQSDYKISDERFETLVDKLKKLPNQCITLYIQNGCSIFVNEIFNQYRIRGIDFIKYFNSKFNNNGEPFSLPEADIIVIYNVGLEPALNTAYSAKLLLGLTEQIKQENAHIFLCSHLPVSKFEGIYSIPIVNKISVTKRPEESIF